MAIEFTVDTSPPNGARDASLIVAHAPKTWPGPHRRFRGFFEHLQTGFRHPTMQTGFHLMFDKIFRQFVDEPGRRAGEPLVVDPAAGGM